MIGVSQPAADDPTPDARDIRARPPDRRTPQMPWPTYPAIYRTAPAHEEGGALLIRDVDGAVRLRDLRDVRRFDLTRVRTGAPGQLRVETVSNSMTIAITNVGSDSNVFNEADNPQEDFTAKDFRTWAGTVLAAIGKTSSGTARRTS